MVYLDNAATTWPKPLQVNEAVCKMIENAANPGRGGHRMALDAGRVVLETRELLAQLFNIKDPSRLIFTLNATEAINLGIKGLLKPGDHVITSSMEHNAVARPLQVMEDNGVKVSHVQCTPQGYLEPEELKAQIKINTKMIIMTHASNVTGTLMPIKEVGRIARENEIVFMVDAAQTAGVYDINIEEMNIDLMAFPGHKGLLGPQGTGAFYIREGINPVPLRQGGTGSKSESLYQPEILPDKYESGTLNTLGIAGLGAAIKFINEIGLKEIRQHEQFLTKTLLEGMKEIKGIIIYGPNDSAKQAPVVSFNFKDQDSSEVGFILDRVFDIASRTGLHCAPKAHQTIGTLTQGTVRLSMSYFNTIEDINYTLDSLKKIAVEFA